MRSQPITNGLLSKAEAYALVEKLYIARHHFNLVDTDIIYMKNSISSVREADLKEGRLCGHWDSPSKLVNKWKISERRLRRSEERLEKKGFIRRTAYVNRRRDGEREGNDIVFLAGIDLSPFINRQDEISQAARSVSVSDDIREELKSEIRRLMKQTRKLGDDAVSAMYKVDRRLRVTEIQNLDRLREIVKGLSAVLNEFTNEVGRTEEPHVSDTSTRLNTYTSLPLNNCTPTPEQAVLLASDDLKVALKMYCKEELSWRTMATAVREHAMMCGLSQVAWITRCRAVGEVKASLCWIVADRNSRRPLNDKYKVRNACGAFVRMATQEAREEGVLQSLVGELISFQISLETIQC